MSDALNVTEAPVIFSHSAARGLADHPRDVPDSILQRLQAHGGVAFGLTVEAIEKVGAETFVYGTREREVQGVASNPGELPPGEVIVRIPGAVGPAIGERIST